MTEISMDIGVLNLKIVRFCCLPASGVECHKACCHWNKIKVFEQRGLICPQKEDGLPLFCVWFVCSYLQREPLKRLNMLLGDSWRSRSAAKFHFTSGGMCYDIVIFPQDQGVDASVNTDAKHCQTMFIAP